MKKNKQNSPNNVIADGKKRNALIIKQDPISNEFHFYQVNDLEILYNMLSMLMTPTLIAIAKERYDEVTFNMKMSLCKQAYSLFNSNQ